MLDMTNINHDVNRPALASAYPFDLLGPSAMIGGNREARSLLRTSVLHSAPVHETLVGFAIPPKAPDAPVPLISLASYWISYVGSC